MPGLPLQTDAFVLLKRPPTDAFQGCQVFSAEHGALLVHQRLARKAAATSVALDLFDEVALRLESPNQGQSWFVLEARLLTRHPALGRSYETLRHASALATLVTRKLALTFAAVMIIGAGVPAMLGLAGFSMGMSGSREAVAHAAAEDREVILLAAEGEALTCPTWGYGFSVVPTLLGFALLGLGLNRLDRLKPTN